MQRNKTLISLNLANCQMDERCGNKWVETTRINTDLIDFEFGFNPKMSLEQTRTIQDNLRRNKAKYDAERLKEWKERKLVYRRYASLFFVACISKEDNELLALEVIHHYVEVLDKYFGNVCELDIIFNFHKAYYILDELLIGGELQETNKREILRVTAAQDDLSKEEEGVITRR